MTTPDPLDAPTAALAAAVLEVARHVAEEPLPAPRWFALARVSELLAASPSLASLLGVEEAAAGESAADEHALTPVDLDDAAAAGPGTAPTDPLEGLASIAWPDLAVGGALACDLAASAWTVRAEEGQETLPAGSTLRIVVAALEDGTTWSAVRRPGGDGFVLGEALVPELSSALLQSLREDG